ncbi:carbohydrate ABC transporter permease [Corynebacterium provencense]|jgi:multiple sugar transport system permease protein/sn-glycerol 3-phosphate transport system permease protein|uniref:carbohydrate ABC transporter permease n=1 Tax=Corynebacterium provencense TaxID=1737425 RepID=UPI000835B646|nr:carbohydrate ABC transporter permease [Corynebacterium provencense]MCI1255876.1 carbohydrate ABC transporter permease [Corynebacterium provencense]
MSTTTPVTAPVGDLTGTPGDGTPGSGLPGELRNARSRRARSVLSRTALYILLVVTALTFSVPLYWMFSSAVKSQSDIYSWPINWIPGSPTWQGFVEAWRTAPFGRFFVNSVVTSLVGTVLEMVLAVFSAYAFAFMRIPFKGPLFVLILGSMMLPGHVTLLVNYITISQLGWLNTYQGLIVPDIGTAFAMFLLYQQMRQIPKELLDSARIDGAGHLRQLFSVILPICVPMAVTAALIVFMGKWNSYVWPLIATSTVDMRTLPIGLQFLQSQEGYTNWGAVMAGAVIVSLPMLLLFFFAQKKIIGGISAGALKG